MAQEASGAFGYSILLDTDQSFGSTGSSPDANATSGNPGFEIEILYGSGGGSAGVTMQDVDGGTSGNSTLSFSSPGVRDQKSYARFTNCTSDDPIFVDFYVSIGDMPAGITAQSTLRMVFASSSSPSTALGGSASDIGGVDDNVYPVDDLAFTTVVEATPVLSFSSGYSCDDVDADGVCDDVDNCVDLSACNYDGSVSNVACVFGTTWYADADGDGYGDSSDSQDACSAPSGYVADSTDCDDSDNAINPGAAEACDGIDNDCDSSVDEGVQTTFYRDADGDGYGDSSDSQDACSAPSGYVADSTDCDDSDNAINPGAAEACDGIDNDCDSSVDEGVQTTFYRDADGDGYGDSSDSQDACSAPSGYVADSTDCDDSDNAINPGAAEACDGIDNDCDSSVDEGVQTTFYRDADGDGYGDSSDSQDACSAPSGYVADSTDCDDSDNAINPGAAEACDGIDNDCDSSVDEGVQTTFYRDADGDGYGDSSDSQDACSAPSGYVADSTDCDDSDNAINPGAAEACDGIDNDCDSSVDEGVQTTFYRDADGDGYGDSSDSQDACSAPSGYVADSTDCDDSDNAINPGAAEACDGIDNDCDSSVDEGVQTTFYRDADGDGYGDSSDSQDACSAPSGYVADSTDCDDSDNAINPGAAEACDGIDNDCDSSVDEGVQTTFYRDADGDGYGDSSDSQDACSAPSGYVADSTDCDDSDNAINPGAAEACDGIDNDCDSSVDEGVQTTFYRDADGDGLGDSSDSQDACSAPSGYVSDATDLCDDLSACNYDSNSFANAACDTLDACGVCGGSGIPAGDCDCSGNVDDAIGVCGGTCSADVDSDGICDDGGNDLCVDTSANNYTANPSVACTFSAPAITVTDTIMGCFDQTDAIALDLDTLHSGTGTWTYSITQSLTGAYASESLSGSELTIDFSGAGQDSSRVGLSGTNGSDNATFDVLVVEGTYPFVSSYAPNGANEPTSLTGGMNMTFDGGYDVPLTVHYFDDAVFAEAADGSVSVHAYGTETTALTDSSGSLITLPAGDYFITGYTNRWGCFNPEPATSGTPTLNPSYRLVTVPHLVPED